ncbi:MAG: response regulator transcription factor [Limnobacter sp.]|uniref:response regulator transcription factor n=1 Tax=Limnobacter sp. TaxID=2003368 RepID=UPI0022CC3C92|nr:response regulator transcription factor [Limnobacter sp.]MCZ8014796.1 response regulator transcription factor [Limnobacter sp.]
MPKLLIVEDHPMTAMITEEIFSSIIEPHEVTYVEKMSDLQALDSGSFDLVLSDLVIPGATPEEVLSWISTHFMHARRFFFTSIEDEELIEKIKSSGGVYLSKSTKFKNIVEEVQYSLNKDLFKTDGIENRSIYQSLIQMPGANKPLTIKQARVIDHLSTGMSVKEIAREMKVSPDTVKAHLRDAFLRLDVVNSKEAVTCFLQAKKMAERLYGKEAVERSMCSEPQ